MTGRRAKTDERSDHNMVARGRGNLSYDAKVKGADVGYVPDP